MHAKYNLKQCKHVILVTIALEPFKSLTSHYTVYNNVHSIQFHQELFLKAVVIYVSASWNVNSPFSHCKHLAG